MAKENSHEMQQLWAKKSDAGQEFVNFPVGNLVWLKIGTSTRHLVQVDVSLRQRSCGGNKDIKLRHLLFDDVKL